MLVRALLVLGIVGMLLLGGFENSEVGVDVSWGWTRECAELTIRYQDGCDASVSDNCGSFCFYADCVKCTDAYHWHCTAYGGDPPACIAGFWERHGVSPCAIWVWHLHQDSDEYRAEGFNSPNIGPALVFGVINDPALAEAPVACNVIGRTVPEEIGGGAWTRLDPNDPDVERSGFRDRASLAISDIPGLVVVAGGAGAPELIGVNKVSDTVVMLVPRGAGTNVVEYRYWVYSGFVPLEVRVPYERLTGLVTIVASKGIHSFQLRMVDPDGNASLGSNVVHQVLGMEAPVVVPLAGLSRPPTPTPMPVPPTGLTRPVTPVISSVVQEPVLADTVRVTLAGSYSGVEYRWWPHSGLGPVSRSSYAEWMGVVSDTSRSFLIRGLAIGPVVGQNQGTPVPVSPSFRLRNAFDFQVRIFSPQVLNGDLVLVYSEPSQAVVAQVWSGANWEW